MLRVGRGENRAWQPLVADGAQHREAVGGGHLHVEKEQGGPRILPISADRVVAVPGLGDDLDVGFRGEQTAQRGCAPAASSSTISVRRFTVRERRKGSSILTRCRLRRHGRWKTVLSPYSAASRALVFVSPTPSLSRNSPVDACWIPGHS